MQASKVEFSCTVHWLGFVSLNIYDLVIKMAQIGRCLIWANFLLGGGVCWVFGFGFGRKKRIMLHYLEKVKRYRTLDMTEAIRRNNRQQRKCKG